MDQGVDWIALSFVQRPEDLAEARRLIQGKATLLAKIEKPAAIDRPEAIVEMCDGVMVARGDLGVELPPERVPPLQQRIVEVARRMGRTVVVAAQMLSSEWRRVGNEWVSPGKSRCWPSHQKNNLKKRS